MNGDVGHKQAFILPGGEKIGINGKPNGGKSEENIGLDITMSRKFRPATHGSKKLGWEANDVHPIHLLHVEIAVFVI